MTVNTCTAIGGLTCLGWATMADRLGGVTVRACRPMGTHRRALVDGRVEGTSWSPAIFPEADLDRLFHTLDQITTAATP